MGKKKNANRNASMKQYKCSLKTVVSLLNDFNFTDKHLTKLEEFSPFWELCKAINREEITLKSCRKSFNAIFEIAQTYDQRKEVFDIGGHQISISRNDIRDLFGISNGTHIIQRSDGKKDLKNLFVKRRFSSASKVSKAGIQTALIDALEGNKDEDIEDVVRLSTLFFLVSLFLSTGTPTIGWSYMSYVEHVEEIKKFDWAAHISDRLTWSLKNNSPDKLIGCVIAIPFVMMERFNICPPIKETQRHHVLCAKWDLKQLSKQMKDQTITQICLEKGLRNTVASVSQNSFGAIEATPISQIRWTLPIEQSGTTRTDSFTDKKKLFPKKSNKDQLDKEGDINEVNDEEEIKTPDSIDLMVNDTYNYVVEHRNHSVVFGSPGDIKNKQSRFESMEEQNFMTPVKNVAKEGEEAYNRPPKRQGEEKEIQEEEEKEKVDDTLGETLRSINKEIEKYEPNPDEKHFEAQGPQAVSTTDRTIISNEFGNENNDEKEECGYDEETYFEETGSMDFHHTESVVLKETDVRCYDRTETINFKVYDSENDAFLANVSTGNYRNNSMINRNELKGFKHRRKGEIPECSHRAHPDISAMTEKLPTEEQNKQGTDQEEKQKRELELMRKDLLKTGKELSDAAREMRQKTREWEEQRQIYKTEIEGKDEHIVELTKENLSFKKTIDDLEKGKQELEQEVEKLRIANAKQKAEYDQQMEQILTEADVHNLTQEHAIRTEIEHELQIKFQTPPSYVGRIKNRNDRKPRKEYTPETHQPPVTRAQARLDAAAEETPASESVRRNGKETEVEAGTEMNLLEEELADSNVQKSMRRSKLIEKKQKAEASSVIDLDNLKDVSPAAKKRKHVMISKNWDMTRFLSEDVYEKIMHIHQTEGISQVLWRKIDAQMNIQCMVTLEHMYSIMLGKELASSVIHGNSEFLRNQYNFDTERTFCIFNPLIWTYIREGKTYEALRAKEIDEVITRHRKKPYNFLLFPMNSNGGMPLTTRPNHWTLLVYNRRDKTWQFYNTNLTRRKDRYLEKDARLVANYVEEKIMRSKTTPSFYFEINTEICPVENCPQQGDTMECGVYVCRLIEMLVKKIEVPKHITRQEMNKYKAYLISKFVKSYEEQESKRPRRRTQNIQY